MKSDSYRTDRGHKDKSTSERRLRLLRDVLLFVWFTPIHLHELYPPPPQHIWFYIQADKG